MPGDSLAVRKSCLLFIFTLRHSPTLGLSHPCYTSKKLVPAALLAFPLSISLSDSNQPADLRADSNKYTLTVVSTSPALSCFGAFAGVRLRIAPHETCLIGGILLHYLT